MGRTKLVPIALVALATTLAGAPVRAAGDEEPQGPVSQVSTPASSADEDESRVTDVLIPLQLDRFPKRPRPLFEIGTPFLNTGRIGRGFRIPGGAAWIPSLIAFGTLRTGVSVTDDGTTQATQWANRLDFFTNLYLTSTERVVFGLRPLDETEDGVRVFTGYNSLTPDPLNRSGAVEHFNFNAGTISHLFFEGDLGELFPNMDRRDSKGLDIGFAVGRQPLSFQEGLLINDQVDAVGFTQNSFKPAHTINLRFTSVVGWNDINRNTPSSDPLLRNAEARSSQLFGAFTEVDTTATTAQLDVVYVRSDEFQDSHGVTMAAGDGVYAGIGFVGRPGSGRVNAAIRAVTSIPVGEDTSDLKTLNLGNPASMGTVVFGEFSWTPHGSENFIYVNGFDAIGQYRAAALDPTVPGPLARAGILFAGPGLGNAPGALSPTAGDVAGGAFGYQMFFSHTRQQLLVEAATRYSTADCGGDTAACDPHGLAAGARYQAAVGRRGVLVVDGFAARDALRGQSAVDFGSDSRVRVSGRVEFVVKF